MHDYSHATATTATARPHDLVWIEDYALAGPAPAWALDTVAAGAPVVVRRAARSGERLPVGVRGSTRGARHGDWIDTNAVRATCAPERLAMNRAWLDLPRRRDVPALDVLDEVPAMLATAVECWGITGAVGYELATGWPAAHARSDLDLLLRAPRRLHRDAARVLSAALSRLGVRCDVQLETPVGGMALADWASTATRVLVKSDAGPFLTADPWQIVESATRSANDNAPWA